ncbi:MAG: hypothetical protein NC411_06835 [Bacteroides sp.]|nr:hypothetical protein [Bacteroides sp.]
MLSLLDLRDSHFITVAGSIIRKLPAGTHVDIESIARQASQSPAPMYYCTYDYALRMLRVLRHGRLTLRRDRRLKQWEELNERVSRLMEKRAIRLPEALANVLAEGNASQFFISPSTASTLIRRNYNRIIRLITTQLNP